MQTLMHSFQNENPMLIKGNNPHADWNAAETAKCKNEMKMMPKTTLGS